jgi:hypothetical protein
MHDKATPSRRFHWFPICQAILSAVAVYCCAKGYFSDLVVVSVIGGALGASLHILDSLLDHRTQRVRADAQDIPTSAAFQYLIGRFILGGVSGYIAYNFASVWHWLDATALKNYGDVLSLTILAGFSTTTLSVLSGRVFGKDAHTDAHSRAGSKAPEALSPPDGGAGGHGGAAHKHGGSSHGAIEGGTHKQGDEMHAPAPTPAPATAAVE